MGLRLFSVSRVFEFFQGVGVKFFSEGGSVFWGEGDEAVMSDILNEHFVSAVNCSASKPPTFDCQCPHDILSSIDFTESDIENLLIKVKPFKAIGPDEIHPHVLHEVPTFADHYLF